MAHRFALVACRSAEIVAAAADAARKKLLVDHPIRQPFFAARNDLRANTPKSRIEIFIAKCHWIFFDMTISIDDAHVNTSIACNIYVGI
jgi:hypothetical protein